MVEHLQGQIQTWAKACGSMQLNWRRVTCIAAELSTMTRNDDADGLSGISASVKAGRGAFVFLSLQDSYGLGLGGQGS